MVVFDLPLTLPLQPVSLVSLHCDTLQMCRSREQCGVITINIAIAIFVLVLVAQNDTLGTCVWREQGLSLLCHYQCHCNHCPFQSFKYLQHPTIFIHPQSILLCQNKFATIFYGVTCKFQEGLVGTDFLPFQRSPLTSFARQVRGQGKTRHLVFLVVLSSTSVSLFSLLWMCGVFALPLTSALLSVSLVTLQCTDASRLQTEIS